MADPTFHEIEYQAWSERAADYDAIFAAVSTQAIDPILEALEPVQDKRHLDVACGTGHLVAAASRRGAISEGVDFAPAMVAAARKNYPVELFQAADAMELPYEDGTFDLVTCSFGLNNMENPQRAVAEAFRVLKAGGLLAFTLWYGAEDGNTTQAIIKAAISQYATEDFKLPESWTQLRNPDKKTCEALAWQAGFRGPVFKHLPIVWQVRTALEVIDQFMRLSVRSKRMIKLQPAAVQGRIYQQIQSDVEARRVNGFIPLDWPALLTITQKPHTHHSNKVPKKLEAKYNLFDSLEEMLAPETLSELLSQTITKAEQQPMDDHSGLAGGILSYVNTDVARLALKQMSIGHDWLMHASNDQQCRSVRLWQFGLLDELRPYLEHKIIACARNGDGWAILMHDLNDGLFGGWENSIPPKQVPVFLDRLARLHAAFWNDPRLENPRLGLFDIDKKLKWAAFALTSKDNDPLEKIPLWNDVVRVWIREGWEIMAEHLDRDVYLQLSRLRDDPKLLRDALERYPYTLLHGDYRAQNLAYLEPDQPVAIDWQQATRSLMTIDLAWFTSQWSYVLDAIGKTRLQKYYRRRLETYLGMPFDNRTWGAMVDLGELVDVVLSACIPAYWSKHTELPEERAFLEKRVKQCNQRVRAGVRWL